MDAKRSRKHKARKEQRKLWAVIGFIGGAFVFFLFAVSLANKSDCLFIGSWLGLMLTFLCTTMGNLASAALSFLAGFLMLWFAAKEYRDYRYLTARHKKA
jgi:hypothetical protein